jgi:hypothetical protein
LFEVGELVASGSGTTPFIPERARVTWWATGLPMRAEVRPLEPLAIVAEAGMVVPLLSDSFYFDTQPQIEVFRVPPAAFDAKIGLVARVW